MTSIFGLGAAAPGPVPDEPGFSSAAFVVAGFSSATSTELDLPPSAGCKRKLTVFVSDGCPPAGVAEAFPGTEAATGLTGATRGAAGVPCKQAKVVKVPATNSVEASAPHLVLRFQNSAAIITGAIAANPENANRIAISKMPC